MIEKRDAKIRSGEHVTVGYDPWLKMAAAVAV